MKKFLLPTALAVTAFGIGVGVKIGVSHAYTRSPYAPPPRLLQLGEVRETLQKAPVTPTNPEISPVQPAPKTAIASEPASAPASEPAATPAVDDPPVDSTPAPPTPPAGLEWGKQPGGVELTP